MSYLNEVECCGAAEAAEIRSNISGAANLRDIYETWWDNYHLDKTVDGPPIIFFTVRKANAKSGSNLVAEIRKHKLGTVSAGPWVANPNTGNKLKGYLWTVKPRNFHAYAKKQKWYEKEYFIKETRERGYPTWF